MGTKERRAREKAARRQQILMAARHLLLSEGLNATSINKIAEQAELGVGTLYFYFKSKAEIFIALQKAGLKLLADKVREAVRSAEDPREQISRMARAYLAFSVENKDYFDIINYFIASPDIIFSTTGWRPSSMRIIPSVFTSGRRKSLRSATSARLNKMSQRDRKRAVR